MLYTSAVCAPSVAIRLPALNCAWRAQGLIRTHVPYANNLGGDRLQRDSEARGRQKHRCRDAMRYAMRPARDLRIPSRRAPAEAAGRCSLDFFRFLTGRGHAHGWFDGPPGAQYSLRYLPRYKHYPLNVPMLTPVRRVRQQAGGTAHARNAPIDADHVRSRRRAAWWQFAGGSAAGV